MMNGRGSLRHSQLAPGLQLPVHFQYYTTVTGFHTEIQSDKVSVRNFSTTETENHRLGLAFKRHPLKSYQSSLSFQLESSVLRARFPLGVFHGRPPFAAATDSLPVFPTAARHSPPPSYATRDAARMQWGWAWALLVVPTGARHWKAARQGSGVTVVSPVRCHVHVTSSPVRCY